MSSVAIKKIGSSRKVRIIHSGKVSNKFASRYRSLTLKYAFVRGVISATFAFAGGERSLVVYPAFNISCTHFNANANIVFLDNFT